jgi:putative hydrolase of the HAD superfamily
MQNARSKIKAVFFDLGFTLIYFNGDFEKIVSDSYSILANRLIEAGYPLDADEFARRFTEKMRAYYKQREIDLIERPVDQFVKEILAEIHDQHIPAQIARMAMNEMYLNTEKHWQIEAETHATLKTLRDMQFKLGLITNASDAWDVNNLIDEYGLRSYFSAILISASEGIRKPDPRIFEKACSLTGIAFEEAVMVGDTLDADILGAHNCGMKAVWVRRRKGQIDPTFASDLKLRPDAEICSLAELPGILETWS